MEVANTILMQIGGGHRLASMTGAGNFVGSEDSIQFSIGRGAKEMINKVKITLNSDDLYDVEFGRIWGMEYKTIKKVSGVFCADLMDTFEEATGFYLTFGARK